MADRPDTCILRFFDPRAGASAYPDPGNSHLPPYAVNPLEVRLEEGQLVVFPSYVFNAVSPSFGRDTRSHSRNKLLVRLSDTEAIAFVADSQQYAVALYTTISGCEVGWQHASGVL